MRGREGGRERERERVRGGGGGGGGEIKGRKEGERSVREGVSV